MLNNLTIDPAHQGQGAGSLLLKWGVVQADERGLAICLESTPAGLKLYEKFGFREVKVIKADMHQFGWKEPYDEEECRRVFMIREPRDD